MTEEKHRKFSVIIGNPPYQEETSGVSEKNGQKSVKNIFQYFQEDANKVANDIVTLIYPGGRWIHRFGKGMAEFGLKQINDVHLKQVEFYPDSNEVFDNVAVPPSPGVTEAVKVFLVSSEPALTMLEM